MQNNNRFLTTPKMNSRFPSTGHSNPFNAFNSGGRFADRNRGRAPPTNTRASALLDPITTDNERRNLFEASKGSRFRNLTYNRENTVFSGEREQGRHQENRFRDNRRNYFTRRPSTRSKKPSFSLKEQEFPSLDGSVKKCTVKNKPKAFGEAAARGKK